MGGVVNAWGRHPNLGSLGPSHQWHHKTLRVSAGSPLHPWCLGIPHGGVHDNAQLRSIPLLHSLPLFVSLFGPFCFLFPWPFYVFNICTPLCSFFLPIFPLEFVIYFCALSFLSLTLLVIFPRLLPLWTPLDFYNMSSLHSILVILFWARSIFFHLFTHALPLDLRCDPPIRQFIHHMMYSLI